jgi:hypothetical protein
MLNLEMAKHCDSEKSLSVTQYKTSNENMGLVYCCSLADKAEKKSDAAVKAAPPAAAAPAKPAGNPQLYDRR